MIDWMLQLSPAQMVLFGFIATLLGAYVVYMLVRVGSAAFFKSKADFDNRTIR